MVTSCVDITQACIFIEYTAGRSHSKEVQKTYTLSQLPSYCCDEIPWQSKSREKGTLGLGSQNLSWFTVMRKIWQQAGNPFQLEEELAGHTSPSHPRSGIREGCLCSSCLSPLTQSRISARALPIIKMGLLISLIKTIPIGMLGGSYPSQLQILAS